MPRGRSAGVGILPCDLVVMSGSASLLLWVYYGWLLGSVVTQGLGGGLAAAAVAGGTYLGASEVHACGQ